MNAHIKSITLRASVSGYIVLAGPYILMAILFGLTELFHTTRSISGEKIVSDGMIIFFLTLVIALLWCIWLLGFKINIDNEYLTYRDGFFRRSKVNLSDIIKVRIMYIEINNMKVPRMIVSTKNNKKALQINIKPFSGNDIQLALKELKTLCDL